MITEAPEVLLNNEHMSVRRQLKADERALKNTGAGATAQGLRLTQSCLPKLAEGISSTLSEPLANNDKLSGFVRVVSGLDANRIALCALQSVLHSIGRASALRDTWLALGSAIAAECWAEKLTIDNPKLAARVQKLAIEKHGNMRNRRIAAEKIAAREGFKTKRWSRKALLSAGSWLCSELLKHLPDVFETYTDQGGVERIVVCPEADEAVARAFDDAVRSNPVFMPSTTPVPPWTAWSMSDAWDRRVALSTTFLRTPYKDVQAACRDAIKSGQAQPAVDAVNSLQAVPWSINTPVLDVFEKLCADPTYTQLDGSTVRLTIAGLPKQKATLAKPEVPYEQMDEGAKRHHRRKLGELEDYNRSLSADRTVLMENLATARLLSEHEQFHVPMNCDWRGRVYSISGFNFQREDRVRSLFQFANGMPIGDNDGLWWLKVHVANCGDFEKISKKPMTERVAWVDQNLTMIKYAAKFPHDAVNWWSKADQPWLFLAACTELASAMHAGPSFLTRLPVSFDGSCSGLQHLACLTLDQHTAQLVNLTASDIPEDVYQRVADRVTQKLRVLADAGDAMAKLWLDHGVTRTIVKRNVMVYSYSSKKYGMAKQQEEDLMHPLKTEVLEGKRAVHPFATEHDFVMDKRSGKKISKDEGYAAAKYIAGLVYETIVELVRLPAEAMKFLQDCARALAHEGKPLRWVTPAGLPWINRYHEPVMQRITLWLHDKGVRLPKKVLLAVDHEPEVAKDRAANGVAPNLVHSCDGAHLQLTVNAAVKEGITNIATVHDSFGCLAPQAARFNAIIREQMVEMYSTRDILAEVLASAKHDLTVANWHRLPELPSYGTFDIRGVINAPFAFA